MRSINFFRWIVFWITLRSFSSSYVSAAKWAQVAGKNIGKTARFNSSPPHPLRWSSLDGSLGFKIQFAIFFSLRHLSMKFALNLEWTWFPVDERNRSEQQCYARAHKNLRFNKPHACSKQYNRAQSRTPMSDEWCTTKLKSRHINYHKHWPLTYFVFGKSSPKLVTVGFRSLVQLLKVTSADQRTLHCMFTLGYLWLSALQIGFWPRELVSNSSDGASFKKSTRKSHWSNFSSHRCSFPMC